VAANGIIAINNHHIKFAHKRSGMKYNVNGTTIAALFVKFMRLSTGVNFAY
jgi:hypothetical protein